MKASALWVFRHLILPAAFVWFVTGLYQADFSSAKNAKDPYQTFTSEEYATLEVHPEHLDEYCDSLLKVRKAGVERTGIYHPIDFFHDLKQLYMVKAKYRDSLDATPEGRMRLLGLFSWETDFTYVRDKSWGEVDMSKEKIVEARISWFPLEKKQHDEASNAPNVGPVLLKWLLASYLRGLPVALLLFLLWHYRLRRNSDGTYRSKMVSRYPTPLSLLLSVLAWPLILALDIHSRLSEHAKKAEVYARRSTMLTILSKQELKLLEKGRSMSLPEFRKYLDAIGARRKHSFLVAMMVTLFVIVFLPKTSIAAHQTDSNHTVIQTSIDYGGWTDDDSTVAAHDGGYDTVALRPPDIDFLFRNVINNIKYYSRILLKLSDGFLRVPGGVPKKYFMTETN